MFRYALRATFLLFIAVAVSAADQEIDSSVRRVEEAIHLKPDVDNGRNVYRICAVCHMPEGWGTQDGYYPQLAGQHASVIIKQLADTLARNRDAPTMLPFAALKDLSQQDIADVAAYLALQPMVPDNGVGLGRLLEHGRRLYEANWLE
ncbi:MAG TPA: c-type cytochrome, partial [Gammaproteobacteria bacterium]|nr:c-type cytochrome [Gammaproteobacteria bacterium]